MLWQVCLTVLVHLISLLFCRQRQWCDIILYTRDDEDIADSLVMAVYDALVKDKTEAMETAPPELLSKVQDKSVFILDGLFWVPAVFGGAVHIHLDHSDVSQSRAFDFATKRNYGGWGVGGGTWGYMGFEEAR